MIADSLEFNIWRDKRWRSRLLRSGKYDSQSILSIYLGKFNGIVAGRVSYFMNINTTFPSDRSITAIGYKYNSRKVL